MILVHCGALNHLFKPEGSTMGTSVASAQILYLRVLKAATNEWGSTK